MDQSSAEAIDARITEKRKSLGISPRGPSKVSPLAQLREPTAEEIAIEERRATAQADRDAAADLQCRREKFLGAHPGRYAECSLTNFRCSIQAQTAALAAAREYVSSLAERFASAEGMLLYGPSGTGKDHLAIGILRAAVEAGYHCERRNGSEWFGEIRDAMDSDVPITEARLIERMCRPDFLLISDPLPPIGQLSQHQATMLYRAVESRYFRGRPTFVTVNVADGDEGAARMGAATWDRLKGGAWVIACNWKSYRQPVRYVNSREAK